MRKPWLLIVLILVVVAGSTTPDGRTGLFAVPAAEAAGLAPASFPIEPEFELAQVGGYGSCVRSCYQKYTFCLANFPSVQCRYRMSQCIRICRNRYCRYNFGRCP